jgi:16S rRNA (cytosine1402-N4)-methyltransferase
MEKHVTVLLDEAIDALAIKPNGTYIDATLGAGGHGKSILARLSKYGTYIGIDADAVAVREAEHILSGEARTMLLEGNFRHIDSLVESEGVAHVDGVLADLGWRMEQFSGNGKGFSFAVNEPLVMTYGNPDMYPFTAHDVVQTWDEENIAAVLEGYGEERYARRIARGIVTSREVKPIKTTHDLVGVVERSVPSQYRYGKLNPATRTFQALRIAVNDELGALSDFIHSAVRILHPGGRLAIITFHSLEDRIVKHTFRGYVDAEDGVLITKKPISPSEQELQHNRRSRSAKLRILMKI